MVQISKLALTQSVDKPLIRNMIAKRGLSKSPDNTKHKVSTHKAQNKNLVMTPISAFFMSPQTS